MAVPRVLVSNSQTWPVPGLPAIYCPQQGDAISSPVCTTSNTLNVPQVLHPGACERNGWLIIWGQAFSPQSPTASRLCLHTKVLGLNSISTQIEVLIGVALLFSNPWVCISVVSHATLWVRFLKAPACMHLLCSDRLPRRVTVRLFHQEAEVLLASPKEPILS